MGNPIDKIRDHQRSTIGHMKYFAINIYWKWYFLIKYLMVISITLQYISCFSHGIYIKKHIKLLFGVNNKMSGALVFFFFV